MWYLSVCCSQTSVTSLPGKDTDKLTCQLGERRSYVSFNLEEADTAELQRVQGRQRGRGLAGWRPVGSSHSLATSVAR